jgi:hypothetical protein
MSIRHGLPYGWWKSPDVWAAGLSLLIFLAVMVFLFAAWFLDLKGLG